MNTHKNARFWTYWNGGWCKLTMKPGQRLSMYTGRMHEEGFSSEAEEYEYVDGVVTVETNTWGRDCDGRHSETRVHHCPVEDLAADVEEGFEENRPPRPRWKRGECQQWDEYAEAAGY